MGLQDKHVVWSGAALMHISAYVPHKNLAVRKNNGSNAYSVCRKMGLGLNTLEYFGRKVSIVCEQHFISLNRLMNPVVNFKVLLKYVIRHSFRWYCTHFQTFVRKFLIHLHLVYTPPQKLD